MGKTVEKVIVKNFIDIASYANGLIKEDEIRTLK